jgi:glycosyltransferase involved in cell wall biosynthesis
VKAIPPMIQGLNMISSRESGQQILYLSGSRFPTDKAYGYQIVKECESMASLGLDVTLIFPALAPRQAKNLGISHRPDLMAYYSVKTKFQSLAVSVASFMDPFYSDTSPVWSALKILLFDVRSRGFIKRYRRQKGAVIWTQDFPAVLTHLIGGIAPGDILVFECQDLPKQVFALFSRRVRKLTRVIVTTSGLKNEFLKIGYAEERILVLPNAVAADDFSIPEDRAMCRRQLGLPKERPIIGYIGKFHTYGQEKGISTLIRSAYYLKQDSANLPLILLVGGPGVLAEGYFRIAATAGIPREMLRFVDFQPRSEVPKWIKACDVCVVPSPAKKLFMESACPMKLFEYLATGVPVVASDLPAIRDIIQDGNNGLLVVPDDPKALAEGISRILQDRDFGENLARNGFHTVSNNSWERRAARAVSFVTGDRTLMERYS